MKKIIVIGVSAASIAFISKLRTFDKESKIICFSGEKDFPYNRCFLADFLIKDQTKDQLQLKPQDFFEKNNVDLRLNSWVTKIDAVGKQVQVTDQLFSFDYLFLGMGCRPFVPSFLQNDQSLGIFTFHTLDDIQRIQNFIADFKPQSVVVIGAGLNGIEVVSCMVDLKIPVTVVEAALTVLPGQVDQTATKWVLRRMQFAGVRVINGHKVVAVEQKDNQVSAVILDDGTKLQTEMVIVAAGSVVNSEILNETGITLSQRSVIVDQSLKTNFDYIFAAGDLCAVPDIVSKKLIRSTTWSDAMLQGFCAATSLSATPRAYPGMIGLRDSYFFEVDFYACGQTVGHDACVQVIKYVQDLSLRLFYVQDDLLIGFVLIGDISKLAEYKMWYMTKKVVSFAEII
ncbi:NAD(P)/FAD-dependent oxidoreductase [Candidatus Babeliales bacterium]|nr:NAD(P)/FAD-dependent oxidoreductase [Candidatus Babeliales bacterium]